MSTAKQGPAPCLDQSARLDAHVDQDGAPTLIPPDPTSLEAWIRQVLRLAGPRVSSFMPPPEPAGEEDGPPAS
ncbi:hypothetical protein Pth03_71150 [Planotetraspora thailandica]|uniref:Uncharacterized protein n=1 Tax=Planotetraspora thailandica TaxID=487172 RepID=A0A8J4DE53_9ACTN|nr:hypothetical protein [Planotetraspora thailandica]GII58726.1 hypothetical protein Pth03_71150 [Planotetraspora thailandica]